MLEFGDGQYLFKLKLKQIAELQEKSKAGIGTIYMRVELGDYHAEDLWETIRLGLIGGGKGVLAATEEEVKVDDVKAIRLMQRYLTEKPLQDWYKLARAILGACVVGYIPEGKKPGKDEPQAPASETDGSVSPQPMPTGPTSEGSAQET